MTVKITVYEGDLTVEAWPSKDGKIDYHISRESNSDVHFSLRDEEVELLARMLENAAQHAHKRDW